MSYVVHCADACGLVRWETGVQTLAEARAIATDWRSRSPEYTTRVLDAESGLQVEEDGR